MRELMCHQAAARKPEDGPIDDGSCRPARESGGCRIGTPLEKVIGPSPASGHVKRNRLMATSIGIGR